jgi:predicted deacylase
LGWNLDALHADIAAGRLNSGSANTRNDDDRQEYPEQSVISIIHVMIRGILFTTFAACLISTAVAEDRFCQNDLFTIDARYDAGAFAKCKFKSDDMVELTIKPEDYKVVVEQPWFSFKVTSASSDTIHIKLKFPSAYARYWPKISSDGVTWRRADNDAVNTSKNKKEMDVVVDVTPGGTWISAQELITQSYYDTWLAALSAHEEISVATIGMSTEGRPIQLAKTANKPEVILLLGRQHPAEVPGALAMRDFIDFVLGESELAREFRERFTLLIVPLMNPDGVANGHWRHNSGRTDLNRDWGPFTQPETRTIAKLMTGIDDMGMQPRLMLDFHATKFTDSILFYTQTEEDVTNPVSFATNWLTSVAERIPDYSFKHDPRPISEQPNTKGYFYVRYGIPSFTYEIGDEADREQLHAVTPAFAEEMMRVMLQADRP